MNIDFSFQGKSHDVAVANLMSLYWRVLKANWTYLSIVVFINIRYVPPIVRKSIRIICVHNCQIHKIGSSLLVSCALRQFDWILLGHFLDNETWKTTTSIGCR